MEKVQVFAKCLDLSVWLDKGLKLWVPLTLAFNVYKLSGTFTVQRALPWPPNKAFYKLSANQDVWIWLTVTPPCKVDKL